MACAFNFSLCIIQKTCYIGLYLFFQDDSPLFPEWMSELGKSSRSYCPYSCGLSRIFPARKGCCICLFQTGPQGCYHCFFAVFGYHMKQQFHIVPVIARLFPFQIPEPQNNGGVIFRPLSDPDLQVTSPLRVLVLMMSFVTYIFPFPGHNSCLHMSLPLSLSYSSICPLFSRSHTTVFRFL